MHSPCSFNTTSLTNNNSSGNNEDIFVGKYSEAGALVWVKSAGGIYRDMSTDISSTSNGEVTITGKLTSNTMAFGSTNLTSGGAGYYSDLFIAKLGIPTGINNYSSKSYLSVYPNPGNGIFHLKFDQASELKSTGVFVANILGQTVYSKPLIQNITEIDLRDQPKGIYFIQIRNQNTTLNESKLIVE